jgi:glycosyltransferase involved in cell wall biosynthesis
VKIEPTAEMRHATQGTSTGPRRILHCIPGMSGGGAERQAAYLVRELVGLGWDVHVAAISGGPNLDRFQASGARLHILTARGNHDPRIFWQLLRTIRALRPDLVQVWLLQMEILGGLAASALRCPWVFSERASLMAYPPTLKHRLRVLVANHAAAVVSNSATGDAYWQARVNGRVARYVIPNAVPLDEIAAARPMEPEETGIEAGRRIVLFVGRFTPQKNLEALASALRVVLMHPNTVAVLCGDGPLRAAVEQRLTEYGIRDRVRLLGYVTTVWRWMKRADVFVAPSLFEGQPNAVLEAIACGCPLVISDIPEHRELLDESTASLVDPHDAHALALAILDTLTAPAAASARARNARARVMPLSTSAMVRRYSEVYEAVLATQTRGLDRTC